jgi:hypothetical protein
MYLVHAQLIGPVRTQVPAALGDLLRTRCTGPAGIEHVTLHLDAPGGPVIGLFVAAGSPEDAERAAEAACLHALDSDVALADYVLVRCTVAFVTPSYEA